MYMKLAPSRQTIYRASSDQCKWSFDAQNFNLNDK